MFPIKTLIVVVALLTFYQNNQGEKTKAQDDKPQWQRMLEGDDAKKAIELEKQIDQLQEVRKFAEAEAPARQLVALRTLVQRADHWQTKDARVRLKTLTQMAALDPEQQAEVNATYQQINQARQEFGAEKFNDSIKLLKQALDTRSRLLGKDSLETVGCMNNLAMVLSSLGKFEESQAYYERAVKGIRHCLGDKHPELATAYSNLGLNLVELRRLNEALVYQEKALAIYLQTVGPEAPKTATGRLNLGLVLDATARHSEARTHYEKALPIIIRNSGERSLGAIRIRNNLAANAKFLGDYSRAETEFRNVLKACREVYPPDHTEIATVAMNLAVNLDEQGKYTEAELLLREALSILEKALTPKHPQTAGCLNNLAANLTGQGRSAEAETLYRTSLAINRESLPPSHPSIAVLLNNLAEVLSEQGREAECELLLRRALEIWIAADESHPETAIVANNLGLQLVERGQFDEAEVFLRQALEIRRQRFGAIHPMVAQSLNNLGGLFETRSRFTEAEKYYREAYKIRYDRDPFGLDTAESCNNMAASIEDQNRNDEKERLFRQALAIRERHLGRDHPLTGQSYKNLGNFLFKRGKYAEAEQSLVTAAEIFELSRSWVANTGMQRVQYSSERSPLLSLSALLASGGKPTEAWQRLEEHLARGLLDELAIRDDRRLTPQERDSLRQHLAEVARLERFFDLPSVKANDDHKKRVLDELRRERDAALIALGEFRQKLSENYGPVAGKVISLTELQSILSEDEALIGWVDHGSSISGSDAPSGQHWGVVLRSVGAPSWVQLVGTGHDGRWTKDDTLLPGLVSNALRAPAGVDPRPLLEKLRIQRLAPLEPMLESAIDGLPAVKRLIVLPAAAMSGIPVEVLLKSNDPRVVSYAPSATVLASLSRQQPVESTGGLLAVGDPLFEVPPAGDNLADRLPDDGILVTVVFPGSNASKNRLRKRDVLLTYGGTKLSKPSDLKLVTNSENRVPIVIWRAGKEIHRQVNPGRLGLVFDPRPARLALQDHNLRGESPSGTDTFSRLPGTRDEVRELERLFLSDKRQVRVLTGENASEEKLQKLASSRALGQFAYIHLATHGVIDNEVPSRSAVILTQIKLPDALTQVINNRPVLDGRISVQEIRREWELEASLVTLSACETARGEYAAGEGFVGFTQALLSSGARCVCLSLWKVDDVATMLLMNRFYANLLGRREGLTTPMAKAEALAEAKAWLRDLSAADGMKLAAKLSSGIAREKGRIESPAANPKPGAQTLTKLPAGEKPFSHPYFWASFVLIGAPD